MSTSEGGERSRVLGVWEGERRGPLLLALGGIHGNEPAGVVAIERVLTTLRQLQPAAAGGIVGLAGNLPALAQRRRFLVRDLNRGWRAADVAALLRRDAAADNTEDRQQRQLIAEFERRLAGRHGPTFFVDLHTSSADGPPFLCCTETVGAFQLALQLGLPTLLGIGRRITGAVMEWFDANGVVGAAIEGGRHEDPAAVDVLEASLWCALEDLAILSASRDLHLDRHRSVLRRATAGLPRAVEVFHRQLVTPEDGFVMEPGFCSFAQIESGSLLARDRRGEIRAPEGCRLLLPLYQGQGEDGFFLGRDVPPHRLTPTGLLPANDKESS